jgi:hypothetical protein
LAKQLSSDEIVDGDERRMRGLTRSDDLVRSDPSESDDVTSRDVLGIEKHFSSVHRPKNA